MKKFLFTLAALLMAGTAFADSYLYCDDVTITQAQIEAGERVEVKVKAHFDARVSAFDCSINIPTSWKLFSDENPGMLRKGSGMTITCTDGFGDPINIAAGLSGNAYHAIGVFTENGYVDGVSYGVAKWEAGDYEWMYSFYIIPQPGMETTTLTVTSIPSSGADTRGGTVNDNGDYHEYTKTFTVTVEQPQQPVVAPTPTFDWSPESFTMEAVCEGHDVVLMIGDEVVSNPYTVEQTYEEQKITFTAYTVANANEDENSATVTSDEVTIPAKAKTPSQKPSIVVTPGDDKYTIEATGDGTVKLYLVDGETLTEVNNPYEVTRGDADVTLTFIASNLDTDPENEVQYEIAWSAEKEVVIPAKVVEPKVYETPEPVIVVTDDPDNERVIVKVTGEGALHVDIVGGYNNIHEDGTEPELIVNIPYGDEEDLVNIHATALANLPAGYDEVTGNYADKNYVVIPAKTPTLAGEIVFGEVDQATGKFTVTYTGNEEGVTITLDDETIVPARVENTYQLPDYGTYPVTATASAAGYKSITEDATLVWNKPATEKPGVPEVTTKTTDETVTVSASAEGAADEDVTIYLWDPTANNGEGDFVRDDDGNPVTIANPSSYTRTDEEQSFMVKVVATNDAGETWSDPIPVIIPAKTATGVDELVNGKTVAGVRYFNMAGQEMQEANGITIVVTTYTDGTTSAVKVIK